jgi:hypothetical protein
MQLHRALMQNITDVFSVSNILFFLWTAHVKCLSFILYQTNKNKLRGLSPQANYTDRATAACRRS